MAFIEPISVCRLIFTFSSDSSDAFKVPFFRPRLRVCDAGPSQRRTRFNVPDVLLQSTFVGFTAFFKRAERYFARYVPNMHYLAVRPRPAICRQIRVIYPGAHALRYIDKYALFTRAPAPGDILANVRYLPSKRITNTYSQVPEPSKLLTNVHHFWKKRPSVPVVGLGTVVGSHTLLRSSEYEAFSGRGGVRS